MNDTFSVESILFKDSFKNTSNNTVVNTSKSMDELVYDAYKSEEDLKFYETYTMINDYNTNQKIRMLKRLNNVTNKIKNRNINNSCESYLNSIMYSIEEDNGNTTTTTDGNKDGKNDGENKSPSTPTPTPQNPEKKRNIFIQFFEMLGKAIKKFLSILAEGIKRFLNWISRGRLFKDIKKGNDNNSANLKDSTTEAAEKIKQIKEELDKKKNPTSEDINKAMSEILKVMGEATSSDETIIKELEEKLKIESSPEKKNKIQECIDGLKKRIETKRQHQKEIKESKRNAQIIKKINDDMEREKRENEKLARKIEEIRLKREEKRQKEVAKEVDRNNKMQAKQEKRELKENIKAAKQDNNKWEKLQNVLKKYNLQEKGILSLKELVGTNKLPSIEVLEYSKKYNKDIMGFINTVNKASSSEYSAAIDYNHVSDVLKTYSDNNKERGNSIFTFLKQQEDNSKIDSLEVQILLFFGNSNPKFIQVNQYNHIEILKHLDEGFIQQRDKIREIVTKNGEMLKESANIIDETLGKIKDFLNSPNFLKLINGKNGSPKNVNDYEKGLSKGKYNDDYGLKFMKELSSKISKANLAVDKAGIKIMNYLWDIWNITSSYK